MQAHIYPFFHRHPHLQLEHRLLMRHGHPERREASPLPFVFLVFSPVGVQSRIERGARGSGDVSVLAVLGVQVSRRDGPPHAGRPVQPHFAEHDGPSGSLGAAKVGT